MLSRLYKCEDIPEATMVHVVAAKNTGKDRIVPVMMIGWIKSNPNLWKCLSQNTICIKFFEFPKVKYEYDPKGKNNFVRSESPTTGRTS